MSLKDCKYLFLDRDGVINVRKMGGYILSYDEFVFINGVKEAFKIFSSCFDRIVIITNQQGIGKGLMKEEDFLLLSNKMIDEIKQEGGRVDKIYFCSALKEEKSKMRKPEIGMGLKAKEDFKEIDFNRSIMVGDSMSDMLFGSRLSMQTVFINNHTETDIDNKIIDKEFNSLIEFAKYIENEKRNN